MRTVHKSTDELSEEAKRKALEHLYDINWEWTYQDAETTGVTASTLNVSTRLVLANHGEICDTFKLADEYLMERDEDGEILDGHGLEGLDEEFERALGEEYLSILRREYEYLTSEESIIETIEANEYEFTENGKLF